MDGLRLPYSDELQDLRTQVRRPYRFKIETGYILVR